MSQAGANCEASSPSDPGWWRGNTRVGPGRHDHVRLPRVPVMRRNVRNVSVLTALILSLTGGLLVSPAASDPRGRHEPTNGFARSGPWNTKLPRHIPLAPNSAAIVANLKQDKDENYQVWSFNTHTWSSPIYTVDRFTPRLRWTF